MGFEFSLLSLKKTNEVSEDYKNEETNQMAKRKPTKLTKALKKCKGKGGKKWNKCLRDEGIKKRKK